MMVKQELINKIRDYFDLNVYETKVWLALLVKGIASAGQIAELSRVPRSRTYDVLEGLEKKGFAIIKLGKPVKYIGVKPNAILEKLKNNARKQAEEKIITLSNIRVTDEFSKLEELYKQGMVPMKKDDFSAAIKGRANITNYLKEIIKNAEKEVIICTNSKHVLSKINLFQQTLKELSKSNISVKIALSGENKLVTKLSKILNTKISKINIEAKFFIIDRKEILFYISKETKDEVREDIAIWINSEFFAQAFGALFDKAIK